MRRVVVIGRPAGTTCTCSPGAVESCYDLTEGVADVGVCASGTWTCLASGLGRTACTGAHGQTAVSDVCDGSVALIDEC
ncbi:MAG: hypothetical protein SFX73_04850 [Kofleriaceae bacterium]|nr:hypothetical protein [Kofleriaceae bacterium]